MPQRASLPDSPWYFSVPFALSGAALLFLIIFSAQALSLGTPAAQAAVGLLFLLPAVLAVFLLRLESCPGTTILLLILPIAVALYLRLLCLDHQTHDYQTFLAQWAAFFRDNGGFAALKHSVGDYNVPYLYFLAAISYLPVPDLYLIKLFSILFDVLLAWSGLRICRRFCREHSFAPLLCFMLLLFVPTYILNGSYWAQCDSLYVSLILLAFSAVLEGKPKTSVWLLAIAFSFKLQTVFLIPLWCVFWCTKRVKFHHLLFFPVGYAVTILPALLLGKPLADILGIYLAQTDEYSAFLTMNAPSVFAFLPYDAQVNTTLASRLGIAAAFLLVFIVLGTLFFLRRRVTHKILLSAAVLLAIGIPFLLPSMHERYFFLAGALSLLWACTDPRNLPVALLAEASSLSSYSTYLRLKYTLPFLFDGRYYVMAFEALLMLAALVLCSITLIRQLRAGSQTQKRSKTL